MQHDSLYFTQSSSLRGRITVPGDKSISHRSLMLASQALGPTHIRGLLEGSDVLSTLGALRNLGVSIVKNGDEWVVQGNGLGSLRESDTVLDLGNAGTGVRLLMGLLAAYPFTSFFTGDASLRHRPMGRITKPLFEMGALFTGRANNLLPIAMTGGNLMPIRYELPVASAQIKSAVLLAALNTPGTTTVVEPTPSRDHTERMLRYFGFPCEVEQSNDGSRTIRVTGQQQSSFARRNLTVPGDPSSAAFPLIAALLVPGSSVEISTICMNPLRTGLFNTLKEMGAKLTITPQESSGGEDIATLHIEHGPLQGVDVPADRAPSMIDEYPILCVAAALAHGTTRMRGLGELRVKESDRLTTMADGLRQCGITVHIEGDDLIVEGSGGKLVSGGATIDSKLDHRIAMSFLLLGLAAENPVHVTGTDTIATSFPDFIPLMQQLGIKSQITRASHPARRNDASLVIAIDGPAAAGKGTLARRLATTFDLVYLDTGRLYRAVGLKLLQSGIAPDNAAAAAEAARTITLDDLQKPELRQEAVGNAASVVADNADVRKALLEFQRNIAANPKGAVLDGRDIGTVICPDATLKLFVTANTATRAQRRYDELAAQGIAADIAAITADLEARDERDRQRSAAPLIAAKDAITLDTSEMDAEAVFVHAQALVQNSIASTNSQKTSA